MCSSTQILRIPACRRNIPSYACIDVNSMNQIRIQYETRDKKKHLQNEGFNPSLSKDKMAASLESTLPTCIASWTIDSHPIPDVTYYATNKSASSL